MVALSFLISFVLITILVLMGIGLLIAIGYIGCLILLARSVCIEQDEQSLLEQTEQHQTGEA